LSLIVLSCPRRPFCRREDDFEAARKVGGILGRQRNPREQRQRPRPLGEAFANVLMLLSGPAAAAAGPVASRASA
jgi:hypothetical protein